jgi:hypothetical protein
MPRPDPPLHSPPLDYVPTAPVYKPRRALRRSLKAGAAAFTALAVGFFAPVAVLVMIGLAFGWWAFCEMMARRHD